MTRSELREIKKTKLIELHLKALDQLTHYRKQNINLKGQATRFKKSRDSARRMWMQWRYKAIRDRKGKMEPHNIERALAYALEKSGYRVPTALPLAFIVKDFLTELERIYIEELH